jgi:hypothetical protein
MAASTDGALTIMRPNAGARVLRHRVIATLVAGAALCFGVASAQAGPCTTAIARFERAVRQSADNPNAGPMARQSVGAQLGYQPTPASIRRAQDRAWAAFDASLARAKRLDARGNRAGCTRALAAAKRLYNLQ